MDDGALYTLGEWCGIKQYRCKLCPFDVLDDGTHNPEEEIYGHWLQRHYVATEEQPTPPAQGTILIADKSGREVKVQPDFPAVTPPAPAAVVLPEVVRKRSNFYGSADTDRAEPAGQVPGNAADGQLG